MRVLDVDIHPIVTIERLPLRAPLRRLAALVVVSLVAALVAVPAAGAQVDAAAATASYVALGDSFSSGEGVPPFLAGTNTASNQCHRSTRAYPAVIAGQVGVPPRTQSRSWACSGATIGSLYQRQWNESSQLSHLSPSTTLVTVGISGNDVGYSPVLLYCLVHVHCNGYQESRVAAATAIVAGQLQILLSDIRALAPNARILVVGYPRLLPPNPRHSCYPGFGRLDIGEQRWANRAVARLDRVIAAAVASQADPRMRFVDVYEAFAGHEMCGGGGAMRGINLINPVYSAHPTALGQRLVAIRVLAAAQALPAASTERSKAGPSVSSADTPPSTPSTTVPATTTTTPSTTTTTTTVPAPAPTPCTTVGHATDGTPLDPAVDTVTGAVPPPLC